MLTIILLSYNSTNLLSKAYHSTVSTLEKENIPFELLIVDDGSRDDSFSIAKSIEQNDPRVRAYQLSRNYTSEYSIFAGLSLAGGDCAVYIPDDGQPAASDIVRLYRSWEEGEKIVFLQRRKRKDPVISRMLSSAFYSIMNYLADVRYPPAGIETALIDREIIDLINNRIHPINTAVIPEIIRLGFQPAFISYNRPTSQQSKSRWSLRKKIRLAKNIFFSSSSFPIRFLSFAGFFFSVFSFFLILFYLYLKLFGNQDFWGKLIPGWTSIILFISFFSGLILLGLGIIAEYIWRIYDEVKNRPGFIIKKKKE